MNKKDLWVGISVPKKRIVLAVNRNRIKRLIREAVRRNFKELQTGAVEKNIGAGIVVIFKGDNNSDTRRLKLQDIEPVWIKIQQQILQAI